MSDLIIRDGTGTGARAKVDSGNRLQVTARTRTAASAATESAMAYGCAVMDQPIAVAGSKYSIILLKNTDPLNDFQLNKMFVSWNGGDTNHNRMLIARGYSGATLPTAHHLDNVTYPQIGPGNFKFGSAQHANADYYIWNGATGLGMALTTSGTQVMSGYFAPGFTTVELDGTVEVPFGSSFSVTVEAEEPGSFSLIVSGWFSPADEI